MANSQFEHMHVQAVALPAALAAGCKEHFERHGARVGVSFETLPAGSRCAPRGLTLTLTLPLTLPLTLTLTLTLTLSLTLPSCRRSSSRRAST